MDHEHGNTIRSGEDSAPDSNRTDRNQASGEPVVVAEQPACPVDSGTDDSGNGWSQPGPRGYEEDGWNHAGAMNQPGAMNQGRDQDDGQPGHEPEYRTAPPSYSGQAKNQRCGQGSAGQPQSQYEKRYEDQYQGQYQEQDHYQTQYQTSGRNQYQKQSEEKNGMAITSLVMGILSLVTCCCGWIALVLGILGIIFAILSRGEDSMCSQAKAGLILSIIGVSIAILVIIAYIGLQMLSIIPDTF
ncbi:DUF4190 domain-containing protein [Enterocloster aldenensis]|uniref:DUF4190 domain-containing protein n=1 Tax=Enterocloster aldenensis TaxID=358742 RepID=UPI000E4F8824|nr:DUF4190 domain-containing protein [Enterocloster aldenensis]